MSAFASTVVSAAASAGGSGAAVSAPIAPFFIEVVIVGDAGVGKTAVARRFSTNEFDAGFVAPDAQSFHSWADVDGKVVRVEAVEVHASSSSTTAPDGAAAAPAAGGSRDLSARQASGCVLVYDVSSRSSFEAIRQWHWCAMEAGDASPPRIPCILVGNKADLAAEDRQQVTTAEGTALAAELGGGMQFFETSAKDGTGVKEAFTAIVRAALQTYWPEAGATATTAAPAAQTGGCIVA